MNDVRIRSERVRMASNSLPDALLTRLDPNMDRFQTKASSILTKIK